MTSSYPVIGGAEIESDIQWQQGVGFELNPCGTTLEPECLILEEADERFERSRIRDLERVSVRAGQNAAPCFGEAVARRQHESDGFVFNVVVGQDVNGNFSRTLALTNANVLAIDRIVVLVEGNDAFVFARCRDFHGNSAYGRGLVFIGNVHGERYHVCVLVRGGRVRACKEAHGVVARRDCDVVGYVCSNGQGVGKPGLQHGKPEGLFGFGSAVVDDAYGNIRLGTARRGAGIGRHEGRGNGRSVGNA